MTAVPSPDAHFHSRADPGKRTCRGASFAPLPPPPCDTRRESATILHSDSAPLTVSSPLFPLLLSISLWIWPCQALSASLYLCVHLLRSRSSETECYCHECISFQGDERRSTPPQHTQSNRLPTLYLYSETRCICWTILGLKTQSERGFLLTLIHAEKKKTFESALL